MKYKLFTAADPSDSKIIGVADTVNVLPEINKQGQLCWRSRPGLSGGGGGAGEGWDLSVDGGGGGHSCLYDGTVFAGIEGLPSWDTIDNEDGIYSCEPGATRSAIIETTLGTGTLKTCYFIYKVVGFADPEPVCGPSIYFLIGNGGSLLLYATLMNESTLTYVNLDSDTEALQFITGFEVRDCEPVVTPQGVVTIECVQIIDRDWMTPGEAENRMYYP